MLIVVVALLGGLAAGYAFGGHLRNLERLTLRAPWLVIVALAAQLAIFSPLGTSLGETAVVAVHVGSYGLLIAFAWLNRRDAGIDIAGVGILLNTVVIVANGGFMPASRAALALAGIPAAVEPQNNSVVAGEGARLLFLGDVMAVPDRLPFANVFSVGDVLIMAGVATMLAAAMRAPVRRGSPPPDPADRETEAP